LVSGRLHILGRTLNSLEYELDIWDRLAQLVYALTCKLERKQQQFRRPSSTFKINTSHILRQKVYAFQVFTIMPEKVTHVHAGFNLQLMFHRNTHTRHDYLCTYLQFLASIPILSIYKLQVKN